VSYYSNDNDASIRIESRNVNAAKEVYLELRGNKKGEGYQIGMNKAQELVFSYDVLGTASTQNWIKMDTSGNINFPNEVELRGGKMYKSMVNLNFARGSGIACKEGSTGSSLTNTWSTCAQGYEVTGAQTIHLDSDDTVISDYT